MTHVFDTLKLSKQLEGAGFSRDQAVVLVETLGTVGSRQTARDLLRSGSPSESGVGVETQQLRRDIVALRSEMARLRFDIELWMTNALISAVLATYALGAFCSVIVVWCTLHR